MDDTPYLALAEIYDRVMDHVDYVSWAEYIASVFERFGRGVRDVLEIACGTGSLSVELSRLGYSITGTDLSPPMLIQAKKKFEHHDMPVRLFASSMKALPCRRRFDAVICIYDSMNYAVTREDFIAALREVSSVLGKEGLFVFDVCTVKNSRLFFSHHSVTENFGDVSYRRLCEFDAEARIQKNYFHIWKSGRRYTERHYQKIYFLDEIEDMIAAAPFEVMGRFDDMSFRPGTEESERVHYVLRRI